MSNPIAVDQVFAALADDTRRQLLDTLAGLGDASASTLTRHSAISRQAIAKHLVILHDAGLVSKSRHGREVRYRVEPQHMAATGRWLQRMARRYETVGAELLKP